MKGFIDRNSEGTARRPGVICVRRLDGIVEEIALTQTQGVYFVKEFEKDSNHSNLLFYNLPPLERLWVRLTFKDGQVIEGMIENGAHFVLNPGFLVTPTDPTGNNRLIFVMKSQLNDVKVIGLRHGTRQTAAPLL